MRWSMHEAVWAWYVLTAGTIVLLFGWRGGAAEHAPGAYLAVHAALLAVVLAAPALARGANARRWVRAVCVLMGLPVVFSAIALVLPGVNPEPHEWRWVALCRAMFGADITVAAQGLAGPFVTEVLQWAYATFYFVPIAAVAAIWARAGSARFDAALGVIQFGFLLSYLGYLVWPTLPPSRCLDHGAPLTGLWLATELHALLDAAEANRWDCFPSGHTMLSVMALALAWRDARRAFWVLLPIVVLIVLATIVLRYHFVVDVAAGLALVWPALWIGRWLFAMDAKDSAHEPQRPARAAA